jgi:serine/threonine protein kinase
MTNLSEDVVARARRRIGSSLHDGKYLFDHLLGVGAMGAVYAATHRNGMRVAIKVLHPELAKNEQIRSRFLREGYIANKVTHPGAVRIIDDDVDADGTTFLVMELLEGRTLDAEWSAAGGKLSPIRVTQLAEGVLDVLIAIHAVDVVHRDVKPENVFLTTGGSLKLLDLGIARLAESALTASGQMMGTPEFVAPEQAAGNIRLIDARTDLYSVGAMMFTLLTGAVVHPARTPMEGMILAATKPARSILDVWADTPPALANIIDVALSFDNAKRWASATAMQRALRNSMNMIARDDLAFDSTVAMGQQSPAAAPVPLGKTGTLIVGGAKPESELPIPLGRPIKRS